VLIIGSIWGSHTPIGCNGSPEYLRAIDVHDVLFKKIKWLEASDMMDPKLHISITLAHSLKYSCPFKVFKNGSTNRA
jgi:hypothetical protein